MSDEQYTGIDHVRLQINNEYGPMLPIQTTALNVLYSNKANSNVKTVKDALNDLYNKTEKRRTYLNEDSFVKYDNNKLILGSGKTLEFGNFSCENTTKITTLNGNNKSKIFLREDETETTDGLLLSYNSLKLEDNQRYSYVTPTSFQLRQTVIDAGTSKSSAANVVTINDSRMSFYNTNGNGATTFRLSKPSDQSEGASVNTDALIRNDFLSYNGTNLWIGGYSGNYPPYAPINRAESDTTLVAGLLAPTTASSNISKDSGKAVKQGPDGETLSQTFGAFINSSDNILGAGNCVVGDKNGLRVAIAKPMGLSREHGYVHGTYDYKSEKANSSGYFDFETILHTGNYKDHIGKFVDDTHKHWYSGSGVKTTIEIKNTADWGNSSSMANNGAVYIQVEEDGYYDIRCFGTPQIYIYDADEKKDVLYTGKIACQIMYFKNTAQIVSTTPYTSLQVSHQENNYRVPKSAIHGLRKGDIIGVKWYPVSSLKTTGQITVDGASIYLVKLSNYQDALTFKKIATPVKNVVTF